MSLKIYCIMQRKCIWRKTEQKTRKYISQVDPTLMDTNHKLSPRPARSFPHSFLQCWPGPKRSIVLSEIHPKFAKLFTQLAGPKTFNTMFSKFKHIYFILSYHVTIITRISVIQIASFPLSGFCWTLLFAPESLIIKPKSLFLTSCLENRKLLLASTYIQPGQFNHDNFYYLLFLYEFTVF